VHFGDYFTAGNLATVAVIVGALVRGERWMHAIMKRMDLFSVEHEILLADLCKRTGIDIDSLPTRSRRI